METIVLIMLKDKETGALINELGSVRVPKNSNLLVNIFGYEADDKTELHMKVTTDRDVLDWEFPAIYDYYDAAVYEGRLTRVTEDEDCYNPTWELIFDFMEDIIDVEDKISELLAIHLSELNDVYEAIKDKAAEYSE